MSAINGCVPGKVLITDAMSDTCVEKMRRHGIEVHCEYEISRETLMQKLPNYDVLIVRSNTKVDKEVLSQGSRLKLIVRAGTGVDNIDVEEALNRKIRVLNTPAANSISAAELTCLMILALSRRLPAADRSMKSGKWNRKNFIGTEIFGKTLGLIGFGRVGRLVACRMNAFGMRVIFHDPNSSSDNLDYATNVDLNTVFKEADYISLHVPHTKQTANMINRDTLSKCKRGVFIVNCSRGTVINEEDLMNAILIQHVAGAALDVFQQEPSKNMTLMNHEKVICTPHIGASTTDAQERIGEEVADLVIKYFNENSAQNCSLHFCVQ